MNRNKLDIIVINLKHRTDRLSQFDIEMKKHDLNYTIFTACENSMGLPVKLNRGEDGCLASHFSIIQQKFYEYKKGILMNNILIFEDDALLCDDFNDRFKYIEDNFDYEDWDMFLLSSFYHLPTNYPKNFTKIDGKDEYYITNSPHWKDNYLETFSFTSKKYIHKTYGSFTTVSYIININSLEKIYYMLLNEINIINLQNNKKTKAIDHIYMMWQEFDKINAYTFTPGMVTQRDSYSNISNMNINQTSYFIQNNICGKHIFSNKLNDFNYDDYFKICIKKFNIISNINNYVIYSTPYFNKYFPKNIINEINISDVSIIKTLISNEIENSIFIDIGANIGLMSIPISLMNYKVYSFEPIIHNIIALSKSLETNNITNCTIVPYALSNEEKTTHIYIPDDWYDNASLNKEASIANIGKSYHYQICKTLIFDDWLQKNNIDKKNIRFIKIDVQGYEFFVLDGMKEFLKECTNVKIFWEFEVNLLEKCDINKEKIFSFLNDCGFKYIRMYGNNILHHKE